MAEEEGEEKEEDEDDENEEEEGKDDVWGSTKAGDGWGGCGKGWGDMHISGVQGQRGRKSWGQDG